MRNTNKVIKTLCIYTQITSCVNKKLQTMQKIFENCFKIFDRAQKI